MLSDFTSCVTDQILSIDCYITIAKENRGRPSASILSKCSGLGTDHEKLLQCKHFFSRQRLWVATNNVSHDNGANLVASFLPAMRTRSGLIGSTSCAPRPARHPRAPPAVSARLYLDRMAEFSLKQILPSVCITHQIVWRTDSFIARQWWSSSTGRAELDSFAYY